MRLQKFLADAGIASRRKAEELIAAGRVEVNGKTIRDMGCLDVYKRQLKALMDRIVDLHGQHEHQSLLCLLYTSRQVLCGGAGCGRENFCEDKGSD